MDEPDTPQVPPVAPQQQRNPLLERVRIPGEHFALPSGGLFYEAGELDPEVVDGEILINPMTAIDEVVIRSPDKLFSGEGINDVFSRCVPQVRRGIDLLAKDVDFILLCLRKITYGNEFELSFTHTCEGAKDHSYIVNLENFFQQTVRIDPTSFENRFTCNLSNGQVVMTRPIRFGDVISVVQNMKDEPTVDEIKQLATSALLMVIREVDGIGDPRMVTEWIRALPANLAKELQRTVDTAQDWGPKFQFTAACKDCGEEVDVAAPLNPTDFFMQQ